MNDNRKKELEKLPFEKALETLEATVAKMESGQLPLDEMMKFYEEGRMLSEICSKKLKGVEKKIEILRKGADGSAEWTDFTDDGSAARNAPAPTPTPTSVPAPPPQDEEPSL
ncbi:MAG: exodeoxyribonuclease VII small subunit, partial [Victivallales bacterium]|nr:exodeoxyribonuclease VII small subunit [Victivallales bacterium]